MTCYHTKFSIILLQDSPSAAPLPPIIPPSGISYNPPVYPTMAPEYEAPLPTYVPQIHGVSISYSPPVPSYDTPQLVHHHHHDSTSQNHDIPMYHPFDSPSVVYRPGNSFVETSDIFFKPVNKKRPPRRNHQKKFPYRKHVSRPSPNSVAPETTFHFVDDIDSRPQRTKVKRFPAATTNNLDVNRPGQGIVSLLKREDLTVMAALLEETDLYRSIDKQGQSGLSIEYFH